ncbi:MAG TPA: response regulator transcription factor [Tepidisphaeraceae bacterium]|jgi:DNA-binding NarL/FixJ family response regulator|nr:response regulator transcription factor [Tepidisphaeraceae bacterium]
MPDENASTVKRAKVLLVDDHPIVRQGLVQLINASPDLVVTGEASTGREAMEIIAKSNPDIAIVDISLEDRNGVELIKDIIAQKPNLPCLALSMYDEAMYAMRVLRAGGRGYVMKHEVPKKVLGAIRQVLDGHVYLSEKMSTRLVDQMVQTAPGAPAPAAELSDRELEVLTLIGRGQSTRQIAEKLFLSVKTVEAHRERIKEKLQLKNGPELLRYAMQFTLDGTVNRAL